MTLEQAWSDRLAREVADKHQIARKNVDLQRKLAASQLALKRIAEQTDNPMIERIARGALVG